MIYFQLRSNDMYTKQRNFGALQVNEGGYICAQHGWQYKSRFLERYELIYITKGTLYLSVSDHNLTLTENQLILLPPYLTLQGCSPRGKNVMFYWIDFSTDHAGDLNMPPFMEPVDVLYQNECTMLLSMLCKTIVTEKKSNIPETLMILILYTANKSRDFQAENGLVGKVQEFIELHISESLTAQSVADSVNYHKDYVNRVVKKYTGYSLKEYINRRKMDSARRLLRTTEYSVDEISGLLGYTDGNLFTKFFTYHQHISPMSYRHGAE